MREQTYNKKLATVSAVILIVMLGLICLALHTLVKTRERSISITTTGGDYLVYHGTVADTVGDITVTDGWLVGYELSDTYGGMHTMNKETAAEVLQSLREVSDTLKITESTDTNIKEARQKIEAIIRIIEDAEMPQDAST